MTVPAGRRSLPEIQAVQDPKYRLLEACSLLEYLLHQIDPNVSSNEMHDLGARVRSHRALFFDPPSILSAIVVRNRATHYIEGRHPSGSELADASQHIIHAIQHEVLPHVSDGVRATVLPIASADPTQQSPLSSHGRASGLRLRSAGALLLFVLVIVVLALIRVARSPRDYESSPSHADRTATQDTHDERASLLEQATDQLARLDSLKTILRESGTLASEIAETNSRKIAYYDHTFVEWSRRITELEQLTAVVQALNTSLETQLESISDATKALPEDPARSLRDDDFRSRRYAEEAETLSEFVHAASIRFSAMEIPAGPHEELDERIAREAEELRAAASIGVAQQQRLKRIRAALVAHLRGLAHDPDVIGRHGYALAESPDEKKPWHWQLEAAQQVLSNNSWYSWACGQGNSARWYREYGGQPLATPGQWQRDVFLRRSKAEFYLLVIERPELFLTKEEAIALRGSPSRSEPAELPPLEEALHFLRHAFPERLPDVQSDMVAYLRGLARDPELVRRHGYAVAATPRANRPWHWPPDRALAAYHADHVWARFATSLWWYEQATGTRQIARELVLASRESEGWRRTRMHTEYRLLCLARPELFLNESEAADLPHPPIARSDASHTPLPHLEDVLLTSHLRSLFARDPRVFR